MKITIHVGRIRSHSDGGYEVRLPGGDVILERDGRGLTRDRALVVLDELDKRNLDSGSESCPLPGSLAIAARRGDGF